MTKAKVTTILMGVLILSACSLGNPVEKVKETVTEKGAEIKTQVTEEMFKDIADELVRKNLVATMNQGKVRTRTTSGTGEEAMVTITELDMSGGNYRYKTSQEIKGELKNEMVFMGEAIYLKDYSDGSWWKEVSKPEELADQAKKMIEMPDYETLKEEMMQKNTQSTYKKLGEEPCGGNSGGLTCYVYEEVDPDGVLSRKFWFDKQKYLTWREELGEGEDKIVNTMEYQGVKVETPAPTKDVPEGQSIFMLMGRQAVNEAVPGSAAEDMPDFNQEDYNQFLKDIESKMPEELGDQGNM